MSTIALNNLFEYLTNSLTEEELVWLTTELSAVTATPQRQLEPYTMDEINARIDESERQIASGEYSTTDDVLNRLYEKYGRGNAVQVKDAVAV